MTTHNPSDRVQAVFQDARALQADALEMMALGKVRNAAEKAWGVTKRATDALVLARRTGEEPERTPETGAGLRLLESHDEGVRSALLLCPPGPPAASTTASARVEDTERMHVCLHRGCRVPGGGEYCVGVCPGRPRGPTRTSDAVLPGLPSRHGTSPIAPFSGFQRGHLRRGMGRKSSPGAPSRAT